MHKLYTGYIRHRRFHPLRHEFKYRVYYYYFNLNTLSDILTDKNYLFKNRFYLPRWLRSDYFRPTHTKLIELIKRTVKEKLGFEPQGEIYQLTQLRHFGYCFNPLTLYYCFDQKSTLEAVVADVGNIPWLKRHTYVLDLRESYQPSHPKTFYVSPLLPMDMQYQWQILSPGDKLKVHINTIKKEHKWFDASLNLSAQPLNEKILRHVIWRIPLQTYMIAIRIHWQALKLKLKGAKYYQHPYKDG